MENKLVAGKYAKSKVNDNESWLIEFCKNHNLLITITIFKHKPRHQTALISPPTFPHKMSYWSPMDETCVLCVQYILTCGNLIIEYKTIYQDIVPFYQ